MAKVGIFCGILGIVRLVGQQVKPGAVQVPLNKRIELLFVDLHQDMDRLGKCVQKAAGFLTIDSAHLHWVFRLRHCGTGTAIGIPFTTECLDLAT